MRLAAGIVVVALVAMLAPACADEGVVVDRTSGAPIPGAVVVRVWTGSRPGPVESRLQCYHAAFATADGEGRFRLSSFSFTFKPLFIDRSDYIVTAYKPGYRFVSAQEPARVQMEPLSGDRATRLAQIVEMHFPRNCPDDDLRKLIEPILRPAYREAMPLARTRQEWEWADGLLGEIENLELGLEAAHANAVARRAHWRETILQDQGMGAGR